MICFVLIPFFDFGSPHAQGRGLWDWNREAMLLWGDAKEEAWGRWQLNTSIYFTSSSTVFLDSSQLLSWHGCQGVNSTARSSCRWPKQHNLLLQRCTFFSDLFSANKSSNLAKVMSATPSHFLAHAQNIILLHISNMKPFIRALSIYSLNCCNLFHVARRAYKTQTPQQLAKLCSSEFLASIWS